LYLLHHILSVPHKIWRWWQQLTKVF